MPRRALIALALGLLAACAADAARVDRSAAARIASDASARAPAATSAPAAGAAAIAAAVRADKCEPLTQVRGGGGGRGRPPPVGAPGRHQRRPGCRAACARCGRPACAHAAGPLGTGCRVAPHPVIPPRAARARAQDACAAMPGCVWCRCAAVPSACFTAEQAHALPPAVFQARGCARCVALAPGETLAGFAQAPAPRACSGRVRSPSCCAHAPLAAQCEWPTLGGGARR